MILALDPGNEQTAFLYLAGGKPAHFAKVANDLVHTQILDHRPEMVVCEMIASYGMPVGSEIFDTCVWIGEYRHLCKSFGVPWYTITRSEVKKRLCAKTAGVNDAVIRQRLIDMYGPGREKAIGTKKAQGPLYGISKDVWAALAVAKAWELGD